MDAAGISWRIWSFENGFQRDFGRAKNGFVHFGRRRERGGEFMHDYNYFSAAVKGGEVFSSDVPSSFLSASVKSMLLSFIAF